VLIDLHGRVAIVTGAGRGIGRDLVMRLADEGVTTVALDVNQADLDSLGADLTAVGATGSQFICDVTKYAQIEEVVAAVNRIYGRIDMGAALLEGPQAALGMAPSR
jgi:3-oxoacyl-[acyl-carrier protein] reductase